MTKRLLPFLLLGLTLTGCKTTQTVARNQAKSIVILYENDVHCAIEGYQKLAGLRNAIADTAYVGVVSCGDFLQGGTAGAISRGGYIIDIMKEVGYDAVTLGNHEFDYKTPRLFDLMNQLGAPITCRNLQDLQTQEFPYAPYIIKAYGDKKVAFIGITTPTTRNSEEYAFVDETGKENYSLNPSHLVEMAQSSVNEARAKGADYVIVLSHLGEDSDIYHTDSHTLIHNTTGIDAVLDGHTHSVIASDTVHNKLGKVVPISQTGTKFANIGELVINQQGAISTRLIKTKTVEVEDAKVKAACETVIKKSKVYTTQKVGTSEVKLLVNGVNDIRIIRLQETNAGDLIADALLDYGQTDIAMMNAGGIRTTLEPGDLTYGNLIDLLPYENQVVKVQVSGQKIVELLTSCTQALPFTDGDFPQVAGIKFTVNVASHTVSDVKVLNKTTQEYEPIDLNKEYTITNLDYTVTGGGFNGVLKKAKIVGTDSKIASEVLSLFIKRKLNGHIGREYAEPKGRITIK